MKNKKNLLILVSMIWLMSGMQAVYSASFSQAEAIAYALDHNPDLLASREQTEAAGEQIELAKTGRSPRVGFSVSAKYANNPMDAFADKLYIGDIQQADFNPDDLNNPDNSHLLIGELSLRMPVYDGGRVDAQVRGATLNHQATEYDHQRRREMVAYKTRQAYMAVLNARRSIDVIEDAVKAAQQHADTTAGLVRAGRIVQSDQLTAELNLNGLQAIREQAKNRLQYAMAQLKWVMGAEQNMTVDIAQEKSTTAAELASSIDEQFSRALAQRQDLQAIHKQAERYRAEMDLAATGKKPRFNLVASMNSYQDGIEPDNGTWRVMGVFSVPLYEGGASARQSGLAHKMVNASKASAQSLEQRIRSEIQFARDGVQSARSRLALAQGNVDKAKRNVALVKKRYGQGRTILIDLLQSERILLESRNEALAADYMLQKNLAALEFAMGESLSVAQQSEAVK